MEKRLYKTREGAMLAGVCAGVAEYFSIDVTLVRIGFVLVALAGGSGLLAYLLAAIIMPEKWQVAKTGGVKHAPLERNATIAAEDGFTDQPATPNEPVHQQAAPRQSHDNQRLLAYILIGIGAWIIMERYINVGHLFSRWWPLALVGAGVLMLTGGWNRQA